MKKINWKKTVVLMTMLTGALLQADSIILDDQIVDGSTCIGTDCTNGEVFDFSTIKLKENNLRLEFMDTSSTASFPGNDWQITINDSTNGGENYFAVDNLTSGKQVFKISPSGDLTILGSISDSSDINLKENFIPVDNAKTLKKIMNLPLTTWNYIDNAKKERHIGSTAQDFYKAFAFGADERHISPKDAAFVAMSGVKELVKELGERDEKIEALQRKLSNLEAIVNKFIKGKNNTPDSKR